MSGLFNLPEEVIWEMSMDDCDDRNAEAFCASDWERGVQIIASRPQPSKCPKCGFGQLMYVDDDHLYYTSGKLAGKLHGCA